MDDLLVVGEALVDIVSSSGLPPVEFPGGSPANVALGLARLDHQTTLLTRIGNDERGDAITRRLESSGVRLAEGSVTEQPTSTATAVIDADGIPSYHFDLLWSLPPDFEPGSPTAVHTGSIAAFLQPGGDDVIALLEKVHGRAVVSYDPNARPQLMGDAAPARQRVERIIAASDVVKVSEEDLAWLAPGEQILDVARAWQASGPLLVVVTHGPDGATGVLGDVTVDVPAPAIPAVADTVGAGDAFMAGLLDALAGAGLLSTARIGELSGLDADGLSTMLRHAARVAAFTCTRPGAQPPTRAELASWPY